MGGLYRHHRVTQAGGHVVLTVHVFCLLWRERNVSLDSCAAGVAPRTDELAQVMRFCVCSCYLNVKPRRLRLQTHKIELWSLPRRARGESKAAKKSVCDGLKDLFTLNWKSCEQNTLSHCMYRREHCVDTAHCTDLLWRAFHKIVIPSLVPRHVSRPAQCTQHLILIFTVLYFSFADPEPRRGYEPNRTVDRH